MGHRGELTHTSARVNVFAMQMLFGQMLFPGTGFLRAPTLILFAFRLSKMISISTRCVCHRSLV